MSDESKELGILGLDENNEPTAREPIHINLSSYRSSKFIDIRKYYQDGNEWKPTKKGITLHKDQLDELLNIIKDND